eukprot:9280329-Prorocentrum_lima.AAC.1
MMKSLADVEPISDRLLRATFRASTPLTVIVAYAPPAARSGSEKDCFYETLEALTRKWTAIGPTLILGDMNARIQTAMEGEAEAVGPHMFDLDNITIPRM